MQVITNTCDHCGVVDTDGKIKFFTVGIIYQEGAHVNYHRSYNGDYLAATTDWCYNCMVKGGLIHDKEVKPEKPELTNAERLEELLRGLVRDEIDQ